MDNERHLESISSKENESDLSSAENQQLNATLPFNSEEVDKAIYEYQYIAKGSIQTRLNNHSHFGSNIHKNKKRTDMFLPKVKTMPNGESKIGSSFNVNNQHLKTIKEDCIYAIKKSNENNNKSGNQSNDESKKINLNVLYYDEHLIDTLENRDICTFFEMNLAGTFYGCHYFELFIKVCDKIKRNKMQFILISSGSSAEGIFNYCNNIEEIREYYIYCNDKKYDALKNKYPKLKHIYYNFYKLIEKLRKIEEIKIDNILSSNLIYFEDYSRIYIKLHYEFIRKYSIYKLLKEKEMNESEFLDFIKKKYPYFLDLAKQLFPDKKEVIDYFVINTNENREEIEKKFESDDNILDTNIKTYIQNYTEEDFYYRYLNKFLREGNFEAFRILSSHVAKFIFKLYDYREKNISKQKDCDLYRKIYLLPDEIKQYENSIGRIICYPSFTSTSPLKDFIPLKKKKDGELTLLIIKQNQTKFNVSIKEFSKFPDEDEYLFLPFSFFKILKVEKKSGNTKNPHIIHLMALNSDKPIEEMFNDFMDNETDALSPEGLDLLVIDKLENKERIIFNELFLRKKGECVCDCTIF